MNDYQSKFTGEEIDDLLEKVKYGSGGEAISEVFWVTADLDPSTLGAFNVSHTYDEIIQASSEGKFIRLKGFINGMANEFTVGDLTYLGGLSGYVLFSVFLRNGYSLMYMTLRINSDNSYNSSVQMVNLTG